MSGVDRAIRAFAVLRFGQLVRHIANELHDLPALGIYGNDVIDRSGRPLKTVWDEYRHAIDVGPPGPLESVWQETLRPHLEAAVASISFAEKRLLFLATQDGAKFDRDSDELPPLDPAALCSEIADELEGLASGSRAHEQQDIEFLLALALEDLPHRLSRVEGAPDRPELKRATISVTAECELAGDRWNVIRTYNTETGHEVGDPGLDDFDPEDDSYIDKFFNGLIAELEASNSLASGTVYRIVVIFTDRFSELASGSRYYRPL